MVNEIVNMFAIAFDAVSNWFIDVFDASGTIGLYLGAIVILLSVRYLLDPLFSTKKGSDSVQPKKGASD